MILRIIVGIMLLGSLAGCRTTRQPTTTNQLQIRVAHVENQLGEQGEDIEDIKSSMEDLSTRLTIVQNKTSSIANPKTVPKKTVQSTSPAKKTSEPKTPELLRVPVAPKDVQSALQNAGYYKGAIDGVLGSGSKKAIKEFQKDHDLESDGIIGKKTWVELKNYLE